MKHRPLLLTVLLTVLLGACAHAKHMTEHDRNDLLSQCDTFMRSLLDVCHDSRPSVSKIEKPGRMR